MNKEDKSTQKQNTKRVKQKEYFREIGLQCCDKTREHKK